MKPTLGEVLKAARVRCELTQKQLASRVGAAESYLAYLETDQRQPSLELLSRLAQALQLAPDKLFLLAHPDARALFRGQPRARRGPDQAWRAFTKKKGLLARYNVQPAELKVLAQAAQLGPIIAPYDFLFILNSIRQAIDTEEYA